MSPTGNWVGDSSELRDRVAGMAKTVKSASLGKVNPLCNEWPIDVSLCE